MLIPQFPAHSKYTINIHLWTELFEERDCIVGSWLNTFFTEHLQKKNTKEHKETDKQPGFWGAFVPWRLAELPSIEPQRAA